MCVGAIVGQDIGINGWIMGDSFLKNVYSVFDLGKYVAFLSPFSTDGTDFFLSFSQQPRRFR